MTQRLFRGMVCFTAFVVFERCDNTVQKQCQSADQECHPKRDIEENVARQRHGRQYGHSNGETSPIDESAHHVSDSGG